jgi:putative membrane protein
MTRLLRALDPARDSGGDSAGDSAGTPPDYRFSLANERTFLAWLRTGLALVAGGLAAAQFLPRLPVAHLREAIAIALLLLGSAVAVRAVVHWARCERAMWRGEPLPPSRFPTVLALSVAAFGLLLTGVVAYQAVR